MSTIKETTLHPDGNEGVDLYPKTNINQVQELPQKLTSVENQINQLNIDKLTKPANPSAESAVTMLSDGTVGTKPLSELGGKLYKHKIQLIANSITANLIFYVYNTSNAELTLNDIAGSYFLASATGGVYSGVVSCIIQPSTTEGATYKLITKGVVINPDNAAYVLKGETEDYDLHLSDTYIEL